MSGTGETAARFITIAFSHYCEKARWALDRYGVAYREEAHAPIFSWGPARRASKKRIVPVLVTPEGRAIVESDAIVRHAAGSRAAELFPDDPGHAALLERLNLKLGPAVRRVAYFHILPDARATRSLLASHGGPVERSLARTASPLLGALIARGLKIDARGAERSRAVIESIYSEVEARLADGRAYLFGDRFTACDLALAALSTPILAPPQYERFALPKAELPSGLVSVIEEVRGRPAGRHMMALYERERDRRM